MSRLELFIEWFFETTAQIAALVALASPFLIFGIGLLWGNHHA